MKLTTMFFLLLTCLNFPAFAASVLSGPIDVTCSGSEGSTKAHYDQNVLTYSISTSTLQTNGSIDAGGSAARSHNGARNLANLRASVLQDYANQQEALRFVGSSTRTVMVQNTPACPRPHGNAGPCVTTPPSMQSVYAELYDLNLRLNSEDTSYQLSGLWVASSSGSPEYVYLGTTVVCSVK